MFVDTFGFAAVNRRGQIDWIELLRAGRSSFLPKPVVGTYFAACHVESEEFQRLVANSHLLEPVSCPSNIPSATHGDGVRAG